MNWAFDSVSAFVGNVGSSRRGVILRFWYIIHLVQDLHFNVTTADVPTLKRHKRQWIGGRFYFLE